MQAIVTLTIAEGNLSGQLHSFSEPTHCVIGRARDCTIHLERNPWQMDISRHHCLVEIDPTGVFVRDLGSLNGTFVNGRMIGKRPFQESPESCSDSDFPSFPLQHGDEIKVGDVVFSVAIRELSQVEKRQLAQTGEWYLDVG